MRSEFGMEVRHDGVAVVVAPSGELDLATVDRLRQELARHASASVLVLDLRGLSFMDSSGVSLVMEQQRRAEREGIDFRVVRGSGTVQRVFEVTGLVRHLRWAEDASEGNANVTARRL